MPGPAIDVMEAEMSTTTIPAAAPTCPAGARADGFTGRHIGVLLLGHCAGMLDLVGLPVWVGANLIGFYRFDPQKAGLLASMFLLCAVIASIALAPRYGRIGARTTTVAGYTVAALAFVGMATFAGNDYTTLLVLHAIGGLGAGSALTMVDGTLGRSDNPHRMFAYAGVAVALFEAREDSRALVFTKKSADVLTSTIKDHPASREALEAVMFCIGKGYLKIDKNMDEEDINRPRQVCPKYAKILEATHPSPMGMHNLGEAYAQLISGLKGTL